MDWESIVAGLLHDTVEDTNFITFEKIEEEFGSTVRHIVEGETKVCIFVFATIFFLSAYRIEKQLYASFDMNFYLYS